MPRLSLCLALLLASAGARGIQAAEPPRLGASPAELSGARFYTPEFAAKVFGGAFDPFEYWTHTPISVQFTAPGRLLIDWGQEMENCAVSATGEGADWSLALDCGGSQRQSRWSWLGEGRVRTDLASDEPEVMVHLEKSFEQIVTEHEQRFSEKKLPELVGNYRDVAGNTLSLGAGGSLTLGAARYRVSVLECMHEGGAAQMPHVPCLRLESDGAGTLVLAALPADTGVVLVEGSLPEDSETEGRAFVPARDGRRFFREPPPVDPRTP